jgi:hypothetical protein
MRNGGHFFEREHIHAGIANGFAVKQFRVGTDGAAEIFRVARIDQRYVNAEAREGVAELADGPSVERGGRDDVVACLA